MGHKIHSHFYDFLQHLYHFDYLSHVITLCLLKKCSNKTNYSKNLETIQRNLLIALFSLLAILRNYISCMMSASKRYYVYISSDSDTCSDHNDG